MMYTRGGPLMTFSIFEQIERENRRHNRAAKRRNRHHNYMGHGLNGERAMARRRRQIASGSLRAENGLCV